MHYLGVKKCGFPSSISNRGGGEELQCVEGTAIGRGM